MTPHDTTSTAVPPEALDEVPGVSVAPQTVGVDDAFARYEAIRDRLPLAAGTGACTPMAQLLDTVDRFDGYLFDSFGVLNVGETTIPGAPECLVALRAMSKPFCVLTNAASYTSEAALEKYRKLGLDVRRGEVVSSRDVALAHLDMVAPSLRWSAISAEGDRFEDAPAGMVDLLGSDPDWSRAQGFLFLSSARWSRILQDRLVRELERRPRPVVIANPDLVAPREDGLTLEPGWWAHDLQDRTGVVPHFFGKPFREAFDIAAGRMNSRRLAMVGDTLHTDILGGQNAGFGTILVTDHGILAGRDSASYIRNAGIRPDIIVPSV